MAHSADGVENNEKRFSRFITRQFSATLQHKSTYRLLSDRKQTFDLVIAEWFFNDIFAG